MNEANLVIISKIFSMAGSGRGLSGLQWLQWWVRHAGLVTRLVICLLMTHFMEMFVSRTVCRAGEERRRVLMRVATITDSWDSGTGSNEG